MVDPLFAVDLGFFAHGFSVRDLIMFLGGIYLIYKGIQEVRDILRLTEERDAWEKSRGGAQEGGALKRIGLPQAVVTIMIMDIVFSIDPVITAVGLANQLIIMILAVMIAVFLMMAFIDPISNFINGHPEMKILALVFITAIGVLLVLDGLGINSGMVVLDMHAEKLMVYFAMVFAFALELIQMRYNAKARAFREECRSL